MSRLPAVLVFAVVWSLSILVLPLPAVLVGAALIGWLMIPKEEQ